MSDDKQTFHLLVESGEEKGKRIAIPPEGASLGRSSKNDITLIDPLLSRHHSRFFRKPGEGMWIADLGSSNDTLVNGRAIDERRLKPGDTIKVGSTTLRVTADDPLDLGLGTKNVERKKGSYIKPLSVTLLIIAAAGAAIWLPSLLDFEKPDSAGITLPPAEVAAPTLEIDYEKVEASAENIFRYKLRLAGNGVLSVMIDDLATDRHVRKEKPVDIDYLRELGDTLLNSGFFSLSDSYEGVQPDILDQASITLSIAKKSHSVTVRNRPEPDIFEDVREKIEFFARNELGLWAVQYPPEQLVEMAREAYQLGRELYDKRAIEVGNLAAAIQSLREAELYLETVEPKPDFYGAIVAGISDYTDELQSAYNDYNFLAERAIRLRNWQEAVDQLRLICELVPDRSDPRNQECRKKLLEVERRLTADE